MSQCYNFHKIWKTKYVFLFLKSQVFIATQGVGTPKQKLNNKLPLHQNFIITHIDNFIV